MTWYKPQWLKYFQVAVSVILAACFPLFGWVFIELNYVIIEMNENDVDQSDYNKKRFMWGIWLLGLSLAIGFLSFL
jgi:hypothetical protein